MSNVFFDSTQDYYDLPHDDDLAYIAAEMLKVATALVKFDMDGDWSVSRATTAVNDLVGNMQALQEFLQDRDAHKLHEAILYQDTYVREKYYDVLSYMEDDNRPLVHPCDWACK